MFSKDDYREYFEEIARLEDFMAHNVKEILSRLDDEQYKDSLRKVADDEIKHYNYARQVLDSVLI